jgi:hypothetical protein
MPKTLKQYFAAARSVVQDLRDPVLRHARGVVHVGANRGQERRKYDRRGIEVVWVEPLPDVFELLERNIAGFARTAKKHGAAGLLNTDWGDGGHYNFMENSWHGYLFGAEQSWNPQAEQSDFTRRFVTAFFGYDDPALAAALDELGDISFTCPAGGGASIWQDLLFALPDNPIFQKIASDSIAPAYSATRGFKVVANFGQLPLKHAPPDETYVSVHAAAHK